MIRMLKLTNKIQIEKYTGNDDLSVFATYDGDALVACCIYNEKSGQIIDYNINENENVDFWVFNLTKAVLNSLDLKGIKIAFYKDNKCIKQLKAMGFAEKEGVLYTNIESFFNVCCKANRDEKIE